jgi:hypothetical protein
VEERPVGAGLDIIDDTGLEIDIERTGDVFASAGLREEGGETTIGVRGGVLLETTVRLWADFISRQTQM